MSSGHGGADEGGTRVQPVGGRQMRSLRTNRDEKVRLRPRAWRIATVASALVLVSGFFLPVASCDVTPYEETMQVWRFVERGPGNTWYAYRYDTVGKWRSYALDALNNFLTFTPPFVFGAAVGIAGMARLARWTLLEQMVTQFLGGFLGLICVLVLACTWMRRYENCTPFGPIRFSTQWPWVVPCVLAPCVVLAYLVWAARLRAKAYWCYAFVGSVSLAIWAAGWLSSEYGQYGIKVVLIAAGALALCTVGEARALSGLSWVRTLWQLTTGTPTWQRNTTPDCPECGYCLIGLTTQRCPECGRPFNYDEFAVAPDEFQAKPGQ